MFLKSWRSAWLLMAVALVPLCGMAQEAVELKPEKAPKQGRIKGEKPNQLDIIKLDLFQIGVNEVRVWYEHQIGKQNSLEFGLGAIYKNGFWYDRGDRPMLANGAGVYFAFRHYMEKKRYFSEPKVRSYISPLVFYRYSSYEDEWLAVTTGDPVLNDWYLYSEKIHQAAVVVRFGWQTARGRMALDIYSGLGFKFQPSVRYTSVMTPSAATFGVNDNTVTVGRTDKFYPTNVIINAGVKLGIRRNNKERNYNDPVEETPTPGEPSPEEPPKF